MESVEGIGESGDSAAKARHMPRNELAVRTGEYPKVGESEDGEHIVSPYDPEKADS